MVGDIRIDGNEEGLFTDSENTDWNLLNEWLEENNTVFVLKPHPMAPPAKVEQLGNVMVVDELWLSSNDLTLYDLLSVTKVLVTDMSSVVVDFLLTGRPIIFAMDDFDVFSATRGLVFSHLSQEELPGDVTSSMGGLISALQRIEDGEDPGSEKRRIWKDKCHGVDQKEFSDQLGLIMADHGVKSEALTTK